MLFVVVVVVYVLLSAVECWDCRPEAEIEFFTVCTHENTRIRLFVF